MSALPELHVSAPCVLLPGRKVSNDEIIERVHRNFRGSERAWTRVRRKIAYAFDVCGSRWRYLNDDAPEKTAAEYAADAARECLVAQGVSPEDVDAVLYAAVCREYFEPATAFEVAARCGVLRPSAAFDVSNACSGFITAIHAFAGLCALDPDIRTGLVCAAEGSGRQSRGQGWVSYDIQKSEDLNLLAAGLTIGNAAAAAVVSREAPPWGARIVGLASDAHAAHYGLSVAHVDGVFECDSIGLFRESKGYRPHIMGFLDRIGWPLEDVDYVCIHQPSERIISKLGAEFGARPDQLPLVHRYYGNTVSLSPVLPLHHLLETDQVRPGMKIIMTAAAAGITMNSVALQWGEDRRPAAA